MLNSEELQLHDKLLLFVYSDDLALVLVDGELSTYLVVDQCFENTLDRAVAESQDALVVLVCMDVGAPFNDIDLFFFAAIATIGYLAWLRCLEFILE